MKIRSHYQDSAQQDEQASTENPNPDVDKPTQREPITTGHGQAFDNLVNEYHMIFTGKCMPMKGGPYHIELTDNAVPVNTGASRNVAEPLKAALKMELDNLERQGIIKKIDKATPWLHPMVVVAKKGSGGLRVL